MSGAFCIRVPGQIWSVSGLLSGLGLLTDILPGHTGSTYVPLCFVGIVDAGSEAVSDGKLCFLTWPAVALYQVPTCSPSQMSTF